MEAGEVAFIAGQGGNRFKAAAIINFNGIVFCAELFDQRINGKSVRGGDAQRG